MGLQVEGNQQLRELIESLRGREVGIKLEDLRYPPPRRHQQSELGQDLWCHKYFREAMAPHDACPLWAEPSVKIGTIQRRLSGWIVRNQ